VPHHQLIDHLAATRHGIEKVAAQAATHHTLGATRTRPSGAGAAPFARQPETRDAAGSAVPIEPETRVPTLLASVSVVGATAGSAPASCSAEVTYADLYIYPGRPAAGRP
jgi:hypothetical protein